MEFKVDLKWPLVRQDNLYWLYTLTFIDCIPLACPRDSITSECYLPLVCEDLKTHDDQLVHCVYKHGSDDHDL